MGGFSGPAKPGEVRNPKGLNQYTTLKARAREILAAHLLGKTDPEASQTRLDQLVDRIFEDAIAGKPHAQALLFDRVLPKLVEAEVDVGDRSRLLDELAGAASRSRESRSNGAAQPERGNGST